MDASTSISSSLATQNDLLHTIDTLRRQLAQTQHQLAQVHALGTTSLSAEANKRDRRLSQPVLPSRNLSVGGSASQSSNGRTHRRTSSSFSSQTPSSPRAQRRDSLRGTSAIQRSPILGTAAAPPSSLATSAPVTPGTPTTYKLRRDRSYGDLAAVMSAPSPEGATSVTRDGLGVHVTPVLRRRSTDSADASLDGKRGPSSRIPTPVIPRGHVGTATTLAGGSPRSPLIPDEEFHDTGISSESASYDNVLMDTTNTPAAYRESAESTAPRKLHKQPPNGLLAPDVQVLDRPVSPLTRLVRRAKGQLEEREDSASLKSPHMARGSSSPFFGASAGFTERHAARVASAQSGTSKVIMTLQTDLTNSRAQLESTRTQLRASARAVESLTRQLEDQKEAKERLRMEVQAVATTLSRRERMLEDTLLRARHAEVALQQVEEEKKTHAVECARRTTDLEARLREAEERRAKAESEYNALRSSSASTYEGWRRELKAAKKDQVALRLLCEKDANAAEARHAAMQKSLTIKASTTEDVSKALDDFSQWRKTLQHKYESQLSELHKLCVHDARENEQLLGRAHAVREELERIKHAMRQHVETELQNQ